MVDKQDRSALVDILQWKIDAISLKLGVREQWRQLAQIPETSALRDPEQGKWHIHAHDTTRTDVPDQRLYALPRLLRTLRNPVWDGCLTISHISQGLVTNEARRLALDFSCCVVRRGRLGGDMSPDEARGTDKQANTQATQY
jgi:hypothetical protein